MDRIDPRDWLDDHKPVTPFGAIDAGRMLLSSHGGNVWLALHAEPELRLETALAWLSEVGEGEMVQRRIRQLADFINAADEARQDVSRC